MRRTMTAALSAAAVIGATAGTTAALQLVDGATEPGGSRPSASSSNASSPTAGGAEDQPLLWASGSEIHDGDEVVGIEIPRADAVFRVTGGYLVLSYEDRDEPYVTRRGTAQMVAPDGSGLATIEFRGVGDVNDDGTEFIGLNRSGTAYEIWDLTAATVTGTPSQSITSGLSVDSTKPYGGAALAGDLALTTWYDGAQPQVVGWQRETDDRSEVAFDVYDWEVSTGGERFSGDTSDPGPDDDECLTVGDTATKAGRAGSCELVSSYLGPRFSPSGETMVALKPDSVAGDQPGVAAYEIVSTEPTGGESEVLATITPPEGATNASLEDDEHLLVVAPAEGGGLAIYRCDFASSCEAVVPDTNAESIVLGTP